MNILNYKLIVWAQFSFKKRSRLIVWAQFAIWLFQTSLIIHEAQFFCRRFSIISLLSKINHYSQLIWLKTNIYNTIVAKFQRKIHNFDFLITSFHRLTHQRPPMLVILFHADSILLLLTFKHYITYIQSTCMYIT